MPFQEVDDELILSPRSTIGNILIKLTSLIIVGIIYVGIVIYYKILLDWGRGAISWVMSSPFPSWFEVLVLGILALIVLFAIGTTIVLTPITSVYELYSQFVITYPIIVLDDDGISEYDIISDLYGEIDANRRYSWSQIQSYDFINDKIILDLQILPDIVKYDLRRYSTKKDREKLINKVLKYMDTRLGKIR